MLHIVSGFKLSKDYSDDDCDELKQLVETEQEMMAGEGHDEKSKKWGRQGLSIDQDLEKTREIVSGEVESSLHANAVATESCELHTTDQCESTMAEFQNEIRKFKQQYRDQLATKCHQLKIHRTKKDDDFEEVVRDFENRITQPVLDKIKLIEDRWRTMDLWRIVKLINPNPVVEFDQEDSPQRNETEHKTDKVLKRLIILCYFFEDLSKKFGWKVGDTLDIEEDICDVVGKLILKVDEHDRSSMLEGMQSAVMNLQANGSEQDDDKLRSLLITKKKYNGLNLACILLEQMIIDVGPSRAENDDINVSWMRIVCSQFIDLVVPLIIETIYREDIRWNLNYFMKLGSLWSVADIYSLMRNGMLLYHQRQIIFHRHLVRIRNFAVPPSMSACLGSYDENLRLESILYCRD